MVKKQLKKAFVNKTFCVACGSCMKVCPRNAISIPKGIFAVIDHEKCVGCKQCSLICPASTIDMRTFDGGDTL